MGDVVVLAGGDVIVNRAEPLTLFAHCRDVLRDADITFANSETTYSVRGQKAPNIVGMMRAHPGNLPAFGDANFDVMSFANNHHLDAGPDAFFDTLQGLRAQGVQTCGAGADIGAARRPAIVERQGTRVAFLAYSSILWPGFEAGPDRPGCAPVRVHTRYEQIELEQPGSEPRIHTEPFADDLAALVADVEAARAHADVVLVSMHWGVHFTPMVLAEYETTVARAAIDAGADAILGHHQHILKPIQVYRGKVIFHGLGHLAMDVDLAEHAGSPLLAQMQHQYGDVGVRYRPEYPTYPYPPDARRTVLAQVLIRDGRVAEVGFRPVYITPTGQPEVLARDDPRFDEVAGYVEAITRDAGLDTAFKVGDSAVTVLT
jgi:poly-gamma-glutamate capsule biosynthesis protein CapA/YwtB (metallophosphatase superfamily)